MRLLNATVGNNNKWTQNIATWNAKPLTSILLVELLDFWQMPLNLTSLYRFLSRFEICFSHHNAQTNVKNKKKDEE